MTKFFAGVWLGALVVTVISLYIHDKPMLKVCANLEGYYTLVAYNNEVFVCADGADTVTFPRSEGNNVQ